MAVPILRIGTRGSPLALVQARLVAQLLSEAHGWPLDTIDIRIIKTSGDRIQDRPLADIGGKGLFTKEIEEALDAREIDLAVHSMKDVATRLPAGLEIATILEREDPRDAFISPKAGSVATLAKGAVVGTSSLRRQAQLLHRRPDLSVVAFRGNVQTRLDKLAAGVADATFLALAGLKRLGMPEVATEVIEPDAMLPAVAQAAIGIEIRAGDDRTRAFLTPLDHAASHIAIRCERAFLERLDGSCRTPIAGHARFLPDRRLSFMGEWLTPDGARRHAAERTGLAQDAVRLGQDAAAEVRSLAGLSAFGAT